MTEATRPRRRLFAALAAGSMLVTLVGCSPNDVGKDGDNTKEVVRIGAIVPSSGPFAEWGIGNTIALEMLEKQINDAGGLNGRLLDIVIEDDGADPAQSANLLRKLAGTDKVLAIAGPLTSSAAEVAFPIANGMKIVSMSQASSKPGVAANNRPWAFRNTIDEGVLAAHTFKYWKDTFGVGSAAIIYDAKDATATSGGTKTFPAMLKANDIKGLNSDKPISFSTGDVDVSAQVTALKALNPDGVVISADYSQAVTVLREMKKQNFIKPVIGSTQLISSAILKAAPEIPIIAPATYYVGAPEDNAKEFTKNMTQALKAAGHADIEPSMYDANIYEIASMFIQAFKDGNFAADDLEKNRAALRDYVENLKEFDGLVGPISFNKNGDALKQFFVLQGQNGAWAPQLICDSGATDCSKP
jgi:ABC-type branched-chain amino acid transport systems, periplasmic component